MEFMDYEGTLREMRIAIENDIKAFFTKHNVNVVDFRAGCCDIPVIKDSDSVDGEYTLDDILLNDKGVLIFSGSNSYENEEFIWMPIEYLLEVKNTIEKYEDDLEWGDEGELEYDEETGEYR